MSTPGWIIIWCWIIFLVWWYASALRVKAVTKRQSWSDSLAYRIPVLLGTVFLFVQRLPKPLNHPITSITDGMCWTGAVICIVGVMVAIWARITLAGNWSSNITFKKDHELIRTGPYRFVRHPIYTGMLLMALGLTLDVAALRCWIGLALYFIGFWIKLREEEKVMLTHFPDQYPAYRQQVKALVPFVI